MLRGSSQMRQLFPSKESHMKRRTLLVAALAASLALTAIAQEAAASRIFAGQHFRYDEDAGQALGAQVADFTLDNTLLPRHHDVR
jgi:hypothetical protein